MTLALLLVYLCLLLFIGFRSFRHINHHASFFVANAKGSMLSITGSLVATILGGSAIIGSIDAAYTLGGAIAWFMLCAALGLLALVPLVNRVKKLGKYTLPDLLGQLHGKQTKLVASFIIPVAWTGIIAAQVAASARILQSFVALPYYYGVIISGLVFIIYTIAGGQVSVLKTDLFQSILIVLGLVLITFYCTKNTEVSFKLFPVDFPFNKSFTAFDLLVLLLTYSISFTTGPDIYSRIFSAKNSTVAKNSILATALLLIPIAFIIAFIGNFGAHHFPEHDGALIIQIAQHVLPSFAVALVSIALLSAVLSSADTTLLSASIIVTDVIQKGNFHRKTLFNSRTIIAVIGIVSIILALNFSSVIGLLLIALTVYSGAFAIPLLFGLIGIQSNNRHVQVAIIAGGLLALLGKIIASYHNNTLGNVFIIAALLLNGLIYLLGKKKQRKA